MAIDGAAALSLRRVARELGMVSSALYRYVPSRDELLTLLIVDAYAAVGDVAERAARRSAGHAPGARWIAIAKAIRRWAVAHPHEYALVYGSPVPGYRAPVDTIGPATRVSLALLGIVSDAARDGRLGEPASPPPTAALRADLDELATTLDNGISPDVLVLALAAWSQLFGLVSLELFGQTDNVITAHADLFESTVATMANVIGLES